MVSKHQPARSLRVGAVTDVNVVRDAETGQSRGCAFVQFGDAHIADIVKRQGTLDFHGDTIVVREPNAPAPGAQQQQQA